MSRLQSTRRRLSLLAGSSLAAASLSAIVSTGAALAPAAALAQATCVAVPAPGGNGTNTVVITPGTYNPGISCVYVGQSATVSTSGAIGVSTTAPADIPLNGINLTATGTDDITWNSTAGTVTGGAQTNGPIIEALSAAGDISITTARVERASGNTITDAIRAVSSGGGNVNVQTTSFVFISSSSAGDAAIEAVSSGGNGNVSVTASSSMQGRLYGIRAQASGTGTVTINATDVSSSLAGGAGVDVTAGTGLVTINSTNAIQSNEGSAIRIASGGNNTLNVGSIRSNGLTAAAVDLTVANGTQTTLTHSGDLRPVNASSNTDRFAIRASGGGNITVNSNGAAQGYVDLSAHTGTFTWNVNEQWAAVDVSRFSAGADTVTLADGGYMMFGTRSLHSDGGLQGVDAPVFLHFGGGNDRLVNNGTIILGSKATSFFGRYLGQDTIEADVRTTGLETFENAGTIFFGASALPGQALPGPGGTTRGGEAPDFVETDYWNDDILQMPGTHWIGSGDSRIVLDIFVTEFQTACDPSLRSTDLETVFGPGNIPIDVVRGDMPAADCVALHGGSTEGVTNVLLNQLAQGDRGGPVRIVLVDVAGGTSDTGHFVLDPANTAYNAEQGGFIDLGYVIMPLVYEEDTQQHVLIGVAGQNAWQNATWAAAAHDLWRTSNGSWFDRQADLRGDIAEGVSGGIWLRASTDTASRDVVHTMSAGTSNYSFDNSFEQSTYAVTGGVDVLNGSGVGGAWVVGLMAGYASSELTYDPSPNSAQFDSWNGGLYASLISGGLYVDAAVTGNKADIKADVPALTLFPAGTLLDTRLVSIGAQVEAGWRLPIAGNGFVEPLAGVSYVRTKWDEMTIASDDPLRAGLDVEFDDPTSLRANVGARLGLDQDYGNLRAQYSVLGRVWNEFEGEHNLTVHTVADDLLIYDEFTGTVNEVGLGASLYGGVVSGFLNVGTKWADDYQSVGGAAGVRVAW